MPRKPSLSELPSGILFRRAAKYVYGIDTGAAVTSHPVITADMAASLVSSIGRLGGVGRDRSSTISTAHSKSSITVAERPVKDAKSLMSGNGITCNFELAEPVVYLTGFDRDNRGHAQQNTSAIIRGKLVMNVQKSVKIKAVTVRFFGKARTEWPEGEFHRRGALA